MRKSFWSRNDSNPVHARWCWCSSNARTKDLIHTLQKIKIICSCLWQIMNKMTFKMPLDMKNVNNFTQWKNGSVNVTITGAITQQKHLAQSGRRTRSAVDILIHSTCLLKNQSENKKLSWSVWILSFLLTAHLVGYLPRSLKLTSTFQKLLVHLVCSCYTLQRQISGTII